jgi:hypothetical protein
MEKPGVRFLIPDSADSSDASEMVSVFSKLTLFVTDAAALSLVQISLTKKCLQEPNALAYILAMKNTDSFIAFATR